MEEILKLSSGALTPIIAIITVYIAYQQYRINKYNVRRDIYEKRLSIFKITMKLIKSVNSGWVSDELCSDFVNNTLETQFLFDKEVDEYLDILYHRAKRLVMINSLTGNEFKEPSEEKSKLMSEKSQILKEYLTAIVDTQKIFKKFMNLTDI